MMNLRQFVTKANQEMYACETKQETKLVNGATEIVFIKEQYKAVDTYYGFDPFIGQLVVFENDKFVWGMNYYREILSDTVDKNKLYKFLRKSMRLVSEKRPFRGPNEFVKDQWKYTDESTGELGSFSGQETIFYDGEKVYGLVYHGGNVKKK